MPRRMKFDPVAATQTAMHEIWRHGYQATSVQHLSSVLGITRSSFYHVFGSRERLFARVLEAYRAHMPTPPAPPPSNQRVLPGIVHFILESCRFNEQHGWNGCLLLNALAELHDGEAAQLVTQHSQGLFVHAVQLLTLAIQRGELPADANPLELAMALQCLMLGLNALGCQLRDQATLQRVAQLTLTGLGLMANVSTGSQIHA